MRIANVEGRAALVTDSGYIDVAKASGERFGPDPIAVLDDWVAFVDWSAQALPRLAAAAEPLGQRTVGAPVPMPRQVFGVALNYRDHAAEAGLPIPTSTLIFTKFPTCIVGPYEEVVLPSDNVDYEIELVAVIGKRAERVSEADAWDYVAGVTVGQDLSERVVQKTGKPPQFSMGKSFPGFGPTGPALVTVDELPDRDDLALGCSIDGGETLQDGRTKDLVFNVAQLVSGISANCPLLPGDLIFTGTPAGVGGSRKPTPRFLEPGEVLVSSVEGVGEMRNKLVAGTPA